MLLSSSVMEGGQTWKVLQSLVIRLQLSLQVPVVSIEALQHFFLQGSRRSVVCYSMNTIFLYTSYLVISLATVLCSCMLHLPRAVRPQGPPAESDLPARDGPLSPLTPSLLTSIDSTSVTPLHHVATANTGFTRDQNWSRAKFMYQHFSCLVACDFLIILHVLCNIHC